MKKRNLLIVLLLTVLIISCADVTPIEACVIQDPYGFWSGLWHGWCSGFAFIGSLFSDDIAVYAVNNTGGWYDLGFLLGIGSIGGAVGKAS